MILVDKIKSLGYSVETIDEGIYRIFDFLTQEEQEFLHSLADNATEEEWQEEYVETLKESARHKFGREDIWQLEKEGLIGINPDWFDRTLTIPGMLPKTLAARMQDFFSAEEVVRPLITIQRHYPGTKLDEHVDQDHDPNLLYASVVYINDNFIDGELYFPERNLEIRPVERSLVVFSAAHGYLHGVKTVGPGPTRYAIASFIWRANAKV